MNFVLLILFQLRKDLQDERKEAFENVAEEEIDAL